MPRALAAVLLVGGVGGCAADKEHPRAAVHPVVGSVAVEGRPAAGARVAFHPVDPGEEPAACPVGLVGDNGSFRLTTYASGDGAPAGEYVVTVLWPDESIPVPPDECDCNNPVRHDRLGWLYADRARSQLRATIVPGANVVTLTPAVGAEGRGWNLPRKDAPTRPTPPGRPPGRTPEPWEWERMRNPGESTPGVGK